MTTPAEPSEPTSARPSSPGAGSMGFGKQSSAQSPFPPQGPPPGHYPPGSFPPPPRRPKPKGILLGSIAGIVVLAIAAVSIFFLLRDDSDDNKKPGDPDSKNTSDGKLQELEEIDRIDFTVKSKEEGPPSHPRIEATAFTDTTAFVAFNTSVAGHITAVDMEKGKELWKKELAADNSSVLGVNLIARDDVLLVEMSLAGRTAQSYALNTATGDSLWEVDGSLQCSLQCVYGDRFIQYNSDENLHHAYELSTGEEVWSLPEDSSQPSYTMTEQQTWESSQRSSGRNDDKDQYLAHGQKATGDTKILKVSDGKTVAQGNVGDKVTDYILHEETLYVFRNTPHEVAAYAIDDLTAPLWREAAPAGDDGSSLGICGKATICLTAKTGEQTLFKAMNTKDGTTRWETTDYQTGGYLPATPIGDVIMLELQDTSVILNAESGEQIVDLKRIGYRAGNGVILTFVGEKDGPYAVDTYEVASEKTSSLGSVPTADCVFNERFFICAESDEYSMWRYRQ